MSREDSFQGQLNDLNSDAMKGYSSSDGEGGSVSSSRKAKSEQLASADISLDNILEGNRRKRAKFESSVSDVATRHIPHGLANGTHFTGATSVCTASGACLQLHILNLSTKTLQWTG